jgi:hypothetical protein
MQANRYIQVIGIVGLAAVLSSLASATVRFPGTSLSLSTGITPLVGVELIRNKSELAAILGPSDSGNRKVIADRSLAFGQDIVPSFVLFLFGMYKLAQRFRPDLKHWSLAALVLLVGTFVLEYEVVSHLATAANAPVITGQMVGAIRELVFLKWSALFIATILVCQFVFATPWPLRFTGNAMMFAAIAGSYAMSYRERLFAPILLIMWGGMCVVSALLIAWPEILYAFDPLSPVVAKPEI